MLLLLAFSLLLTGVDRLSGMGLIAAPLYWSTATFLICAATNRQMQPRAA